MTNFMIRFLICNLFIGAMAGILLTAGHLLKNILTGRLKYRLWCLFLGLLAVPFLPLGKAGSPRFLSPLNSLRTLVMSDYSNMRNPGILIPAGNTGWLNDFTLSVRAGTPFVTGIILLGIWLAGIFVMILATVKSSFRLRNIKQSAMPLQNPEIRRLYRHCLKELHISKEIPIYSTAFLQSPVITGFLRPRIYLPLHVISDYSRTDSQAAYSAPYNSRADSAEGLRPVRYMLLHELQHYRHKDVLTGYMMTLAGIFYWFNPLVRLALREMRNDREIACDTSVLELLTPDSYADYGRTLIDFAEKLAAPASPFTAGLSGHMAQMRRRILNIALYKKPNLRKRLAGVTAFLMIIVLLLGFVPFLSANAAGHGYYRWDTSNKNISSIDLSSYFEEYDGSFVLYDMKADAWSIYNMERAALRVSPDSTYKIYDALFGLEASVITPDNSFMEWNGERYSFQEWNTDQTLQSAMRSSVNWYFQAIDKQMGASAISHYIREIGYGNEDTDGNLSAYWLESSLKISPLEQVELLQKLYENSFGFRLENINSVKDSILLSSSETRKFYGKTGTGCIDGKDINGWFVGYVESPDNTWFFAANISADDKATGSSAAGITMSILSGMDIARFS